MRTQYFNPNKILICSLAALSLSCSKARFAPAESVEDATAVNTPNKVVTSTEFVAAGNKQVDFLLVLDDSNSMLPELKKLSSKMATFVSFLEASQIDWQMCVTTTRASNFGKYLAWKNYAAPSGIPSHVLKKGASGLNTIFTSTIDSITIGGGDSGDERAIKSAFVSFQNSGSCYRAGAAVSVIAISDEDERSVGGDSSKVKANDAAGTYQPLEAEDIPTNLVARAQATFGANVRFTFNSIIVKPKDKACEKDQDIDTSPSHPGTVYALMSAISDGGVGSICDADYSSNLNTFKDKIVNSLTQLNLQCDPVEGSLKVWVNRKLISEYKKEKKILRFHKALIEGTRIDLVYDCKD
ncbi:hypothetical protein [Bdellovibrio sp. HCB337]|uniref:hypothetical protein n=1 Tax=Bdellovibrio sp. HCB337 TaxID=3394358 RepID=UPI0039A62369